MLCNKKDYEESLSHSNPPGFYDNVAMALTFKRGLHNNNMMMIPAAHLVLVVRCPPAGFAAAVQRT
jgi:hypothetical protein